MFGFVLTAAFALLLLTFRSIVVPIKAILLNLLSVGASYGVLDRNWWLPRRLGWLPSIGTETEAPAPARA